MFPLESARADPHIAHMDTEVTISPGFTEAERPQVARLFWQAFSGKLMRVMGPQQKALGFFEAALQPRFALAARGRDGALLGIAGFKTEDGGLVGGDFADLARVYGRFGAAWRGLVLSLLDRPVQPGVFQMDGIFVNAQARGKGAGTALLRGVRDLAEANGMSEVQLDVIDTNNGARRLYEREGFRAIGEERTGPLRHLFGFASATKMSLTVGRG